VLLNFEPLQDSRVCANRQNMPRSVHRDNHLAEFTFLYKLYNTVSYLGIIFGGISSLYSTHSTHLNNRNTTVFLLQSPHIGGQFQRFLIVVISYTRVHQLRHFQNLQQMCVLLQCKCVASATTKWRKLVVTKLDYHLNSKYYPPLQLQHFYV